MRISVHGVGLATVRSADRVGGRRSDARVRAQRVERAVPECARSRGGGVTLVAVGLEVLVNFLGDWHDRFPILPTALGLLIVVVAAQRAG